MSQSIQVNVKAMRQKLAAIYHHQIDNDTITGHHELTNEISNMIRMQRAISWLERFSVLVEPDHDLTFLLNWVSFEALYGKDEYLHFVNPEVSENMSSVKEIMIFIDNILKVEHHYQKIVDVISELFPEIEEIYLNPFIDHIAWRDFYKHVKNKTICKKNLFKKAQKKYKPIKQKVLKDPKQFNILLKNLFARLYLLRNQLIHGNATYKGAANEETLRAGQIRCAAKITKKLIPMMIEIMLESLEVAPGATRWGKIPYPRINAFDEDVEE